MTTNCEPGDRGKMDLCRGLTYKTVHGQLFSHTMQVLCIGCKMASPIFQAAIYPGAVCVHVCHMWCVPLSPHTYSLSDTHHMYIYTYNITEQRFLSRTDQESKGLAGPHVATRQWGHRSAQLLPYLPSSDQGL